MARRKLHKRHIRNLQKSQKTYYVTLPVGLVRSLKWQERQKLVVKKFGKKRIVVSDWE